MIEKTEQEIKDAVHMNNEAWRVASKAVKATQVVLRGYVGKRVTKKDNTLLKVLDEQLTGLFGLIKQETPIKPLEDGTATLQGIWLDCSRYTMFLKARICFSHKGKWGYEDVLVYLGSIDNHGLTKLEESVESQHINARAEIAAYHKALKARKALQDAMSKMRLYDNRNEIARRI